MKEQLRIGVIGTGRMGVSHIRRIQSQLSGGWVTAVAASSPARAAGVAKQFAIPQVMEADALIASPEVDAVVIASPGESHEAYLMACIAQGKPVFCEKPLAATAAGCLRVLQAECAAGCRLVQLGFMRRFDRCHNELRGLLACGSLGRTLMVHAVHRNPDNGAFSDTLQIMDAAIHTLDALPWLLGDDPIASCQVLSGVPASCAAGRQQDPLLVLLRTASGVLADLEVFTHCGYGYDIGCEVVCERGTAALPPSSAPLVRSAAARTVREYNVWEERYNHAFDAEILYFLDHARQGIAGGPSAWDGFAAAVAGEACLRSMQSGVWEEIRLMEKPAFYT